MEESGFEHEALFYDDLSAFVSGTSQFVREGLERDEAVLVVLGAAKSDALREQLAHDSRAVMFADMGVLGENPARLIPAWKEFAEVHGRGRPTRGVGEPIHAGLSGPQLGEAQLHEELLNVAFADVRAMKLMCPYHTSLPASVLDEARRSHPDRTGTEAPPVAHDAPLQRRGLVEPTHAVDASFDYDRETLTEMRDELRALGDAAGLDRDRLAALLLAASEIANNSVEHGGGHGHLRVWRDGRDLVCELRDAGFITDPLAGRIRPEVDAPNGRGLWIVNQLCDLVQLRSDPEGGTTVRLHMHTR